MIATSLPLVRVMPLVLEQISASLAPLDLSGVIPSRVATSSSQQVARLLIPCGNRELALGDCFRVSGSAGDGEIRFVGDLSGVHWIGARLDGGRIVIDGSAGRHVGSQMGAGEIWVRGDASDFAGVEMRGGTLRIDGDAGNWTGATYPGSRRGMRGGTLVVEGSAGTETGRSMRRGTIIVAGDCGDAAGYDMIAGTLLVGGACGRYPGASMRRGSLVLASRERPRLLPTFRRSCVCRPSWLPLLARQLPGWGLANLAAQLEGEFELFAGDALTRGKGEILLAAQD